MGSGILGAPALIMLLHPPGQVRRQAGVERPVPAADDLDKEAALGQGIIQTLFACVSKIEQVVQVDRN